MNSLSINGQLMEKIELCIFDKDGTLIDIHRYWSRMLQYRAEYLVNRYITPEYRKSVYNTLMEAMGIDLISGKIKDEGPVGIMPRSFMINTALESINRFNIKATEKDVRDAFDVIDQYSNSKLEEIIEVLPGVNRLLRELKFFGVRTAVATTDITERAEVAMRTIGLRDYFDVVAGADKVAHTKPHSDLVDYIIAQLGVNRAHVVVIGDAGPDQYMAENAGVRFIGVGTGLKSFGFPGEAGLFTDSLEAVHVVGI